MKNVIIGISVLILLTTSVAIGGFIYLSGKVDEASVDTAWVLRPAKEMLSSCRPVLKSASRRELYQVYERFGVLLMTKHSRHAEEIGCHNHHYAGCKSEAFRRVYPEIEFTDASLATEEMPHAADDPLYESARLFSLIESNDHEAVADRVAVLRHANFMSRLASKAYENGCDAEEVASLVVFTITISDACELLQNHLFASSEIRSEVAEENALLPMEKRVSESNPF